MGSDREYQRQELEQANQGAEEIVEEQKVTAQEEEQEAEEMMEKLVEAQAVADQQDRAEEKGREAEQQIARTTGV